MRIQPREGPTQWNSHEFRYNRVMPAPIKVELLPYSPSWEQAAQAESQRLLQALADNIVAVHHIGSTAIPGIHAKPIVDLLTVVRSVSTFDEQQAALMQLGYQCWGEYGIPGRRYCTLDEPATGRAHVSASLLRSGQPANRAAPGVPRLLARQPREGPRIRRGKTPLPSAPSRRLACLFRREGRMDRGTTTICFGLLSRVALK